MSAGWVAAMVRGRGLALRQIGREEAREVAHCTSLASAIAMLASTAYGRELRSDMDLASAQHAVSATVLWHLRVLAGWGPSLGARPLRVLAAGFELSNIVGKLAALRGETASRPYALGSLALSSTAILAARTAAEVRSDLRSSPWGDPGSDDPAVIRLALQLGWARLVLEGAPEAGDWATSGAALVLARVLAVGALSSLSPSARHDASRVLGRNWQRATALSELPQYLPRMAARFLRGAETPEDLWRAEASRWTIVESSATALAARTPPDAGCAIGVAGLLATDAFRARAALALAANGGGDLFGVLDAVA